MPWTDSTTPHTSCPIPRRISRIAFGKTSLPYTAWRSDHRCRAALAKLSDSVSEAAASVARFLRTTPATAKAASIDILKCVHKLQPHLVSTERQFLRDLESLIGPAFRKFCEAYERDDDVEVIRRAPEMLENVGMQRPGTCDPRRQSRVWISLVQPVLDHVTSLVEDATSRGEVALAPALALRNHSTKADLRNASSELNLSFSLTNRGRGHAHDVSLRRSGGVDGIQLTVSEPAGPFDVPQRRAARSTAPCVGRTTRRLGSSNRVGVPDKYRKAVNRC